MGLDQWIYKARHFEKISELFKNGVMSPGTLERTQFNVDVFCDELDEYCYWRKQYWVQDYIEQQIETEIKNCGYYILDKDVIVNLLDKYRKIINVLGPHYNPEECKCVDVPEDTFELIKSIIPGCYVEDNDWTYMFIGIKKTIDDLEEILYEMKHSDYKFLYHGWW